MNTNGQFVTAPAAALAVALLVAASLALTLGFACALPFAAFATMAALMFEGGAAIVAMLAVWLANQAVGFLILHYPTDPVTLAWGGALGALGLASLFSARLVLSRMSGWIAGPAAFVASFVAFEGLLFVINIAVGMDASVFTAHVVARMFAINAASFGVLFAAHALGARKNAFVPARHA